jgi:hypothetical protein
MDLKDIIGWLFILTSFFDSIKYHWNAAKIRQLKSSKGHSRKFINAALLNDIVRLVYAIVINDAYLFFSSILAMACMVELFILIYWYYPYRNRNKKNFKRPGLLKYFWNSLVPNKFVKRF